MIPVTKVGARASQLIRLTHTFICLLLLAKGMTLTFGASVRLVARAAAHEEGMTGTSVDVI